MTTTTAPEQLVIELKQKKDDYYKVPRNQITNDEEFNFSPCNTK